MEKERTKALVIVVMLIVVAGLTVAFASLSSALNIKGTAYLDAAKWGIKFENLSSPTKIGSATTTGTAKIEETKSAEINGINVNLSTPGDKVVYTVDLVNEGTINVKIDKIEKTALTSEQQKYLTFKVTDKNYNEVSKGDILQKGETKKLIITIEFIKDLTKEDLPTNTSTISLSYKLNFVQTNEKVTSTSKTTSTIPEPVSFSTDSWETIVNAVKNNNTEMYNLGDEKKIDMGDLGTHTVRIANKTTPDECNNDDFSQTACGFVIEFLTSGLTLKRRMNPPGMYDGIQYDHGWNTGGWPASEMREYINSTIYNTLPDDLKNSISNTKVVSGHGLNDSDNFISTDKLYLLDVKEIYGDAPNNNTAKDYERQLDYYNELNVKATNYDVVIKKYNSKNIHWWLRSSSSKDSLYFFVVTSKGDYSYCYATDGYFAFPAFRIVNE